MLCSRPPRPSLRSRNVGQDDDVSEILKTASCKTVWKAALKAWNSKHRSRRSSEALISGALDIVTLSKSFKAAEEPGKRNVCKFQSISQTRFFPILWPNKAWRHTCILALLFEAKASCLATRGCLGIQQSSRVICSGVNQPLKRVAPATAKMAPPCPPHQPSFLTFTPSPV